MGLPLRNQLTRPIVGSTGWGADVNKNFQDVEDAIGTGRVVYRSGVYAKDWDSDDRGYPVLDTDIDWSDDENYVYQLHCIALPYMRRVQGYCSAMYGCDNGQYPCYFESDGDVHMSFGDLSAGYFFKHGKGAYYPQDCWWEEFLVWDMGTPDYNSGWFSVSKGTTYQKAHGLSGNLDDLLVFVEVSESNDGTGRRVCSNGCAFDATSRNVQCAAVKIDSTNVHIRTGPNQLVYIKDHTSANWMPTSARCRVRIWQLTPDYISSDSMGVTTVTQYTHKLGTDALFVLPSVSASSTPSSADWTLWGAISSGSRCLHICEINEQFIVTYNPEYHGLFRDVNGAAQAPTGTGYYKMMVWK